MESDHEAELAARLARSVDRMLEGKDGLDEAEGVWEELDSARLLLFAHEEIPVLSETFDRKLRAELVRRAPGKARSPSGLFWAGRRAFARYAAAAAVVLCAVVGAYFAASALRPSPSVLASNPELQELTVPFGAGYRDAFARVERDQTVKHRHLIEMKWLFERRRKS